MSFWPLIKTAPPRTPYIYRDSGKAALGYGAEGQAFDSGQYNIPYAPYDWRHLVRGQLKPLEGGSFVSQNVVPVSIVGNGSELAGTFGLSPLVELNAKGVLG